MAKAKSKLKTKEAVIPVMVQPKFEHGSVMDVPIDQLETNPWNPNEMSADEFNLLSENVDEVGFLQPILVVPLPLVHGEKQRFRVVDGEHRFEQQRLMDSKTLKCVIADPTLFDEKQQKKQTIRMNKIRGHFNIKKFARLANEMMELHQVPFEELARELGFVDETELAEMLDAAREALPSADMKKEFDKAKGEIRTVEDLSLVLNRLFTRFGDTVPYNFMVLDFGGKDHLWVRLEGPQYRKIKDRARKCMENEVTFDSVLIHALTLLDIDKFAKEHKDFLKVPEKKATDIDAFLSGEDDEL